MRIAFRADASLSIGTGHIRRCLTLAEALRSYGIKCYFLCREKPGDLIHQIKARGFQVFVLSTDQFCDATKEIGKPENTYLNWLGVTFQQDAEDCRSVLQHLNPDWLVVDHYALDIYWETLLRPLCGRLMVIDDLANREHNCDVLLDQNLGRVGSDYVHLVNKQCKLLVGPTYALLRPEFAKLRKKSLDRRANSAMKSLLITMGGVDADNATGQVLSALELADLPHDCQITIVMGEISPWLEQVRRQASKLPFNINVLVDVSDMAEQMAKADLAIGAAGCTAWERCCLGLPTLLVVLAENQRIVAQALKLNGSAESLGEPSDIEISLPAAIRQMGNHEKIQKMSLAARSVTDGLGVTRVLEIVMEKIVND